MDWLLLAKALCLVMVIEGIPLFLAPQRAREAAQMVSQMSSRALRMIGLAAMLSGVLLLSMLSGGG